MIRFLLVFSLFLAGCKPDGHPVERGVAPAFDPAAFGPREAPSNGPAADLQVMDYGPRGPGLGVHAVGQVHIRFSGPVVPLGTDDDVTSLRVLAAGQPVKGNAFWQSPDTLVFEAAGTLEPATEYEVRWDGLDDLDALSWTFETARPEVQLASPVDRATLVERDELVVLRTTIATTTEQLAARVAVKVDGKKVSSKVVPAPTALTERFGFSSDMLFVVEHPSFPVGGRVELEVAPGWRSKRGPLPSEQSYDASFNVHPSLSVTAVTCWKSEKLCPLQAIEIDTSTPVPELQKRHIRMSPRPPEFEVTHEYGNTLTVDGRFVPGTKYKLFIDADLEDTFGQQLGDDLAVELEFEMPPPEVSLTRRRGTVLDDGRARVGVSSRHVRAVRVRAAKVSVQRYRDLHFANRWRVDELPPLDDLGEVVEATVAVKPRGATNWASTALDLVDLIGDHRGPVAVEVTGQEPIEGFADDAGDLSDIGLFQVSSLAPQTFASTARSVVRVEDLVGREPVDAADVELLGKTQTLELGTTDVNGLITFEPRLEQYRDDLLVVRSASDVVVLPIERAPAERAATWLDSGETVQSKLVTERGVYRPGDDVYVAGWALIHTPHHPVGQRSLPSDVKVRLELLDRDNLVLDSQLVDPRRGRFSAKLRLPTSARLGRLMVRARYEKAGVVARDDALVTAVIKEFRTPEFEVSATIDRSEVVGKDSVKLAVQSRYYSGSIAEIREARAARTCWTTDAPTVDGWKLGVEASWGGRARLPLTPTADRPGRLTLDDAPGPDPNGRTRRCDYAVTVQNPSFQEEGTGQQVTVHPTSLYLGAPTDDTPEPGDRLDVRLALFDTRGQRSDAAADMVDVEIVRSESRPVYTGRGDNRWVSHYDEVVAQRTRCTIRANGKQTCEAGRLIEGYYEIEATSRQDPLRRFTNSFWVYDRGGDDDPPKIEVIAPAGKLPTNEMTAVTVRTDQKHGMLLVERFGVIEAVGFKTRRGRAEIELEPQESWAPGVTLTAYAIEEGTPPTLIRGEGDLDFDTSDRELRVDVRAPAEATIRDEVDVEVDISVPTGRAAIWIVDDAILDLTNYELPDLVRAFYPQFIDDIRITHGLPDTLPIFAPDRWDPYRAISTGYGFGGRGFGSGGGGMGRAGGPPSPRADFRATPFFAGDVPIENGKATVKVRLPDNITRFRVLAVASSEAWADGPPVRFGSGSTTIDVSAPLIVRPALPRFLRPADAPTLAAIVQNNTGKAGSLRVAFELEGDAVVWQKGVKPQQTIQVAPHTEHRVGFDARVLQPGAAVVTVHASLTPSDGSPGVHDAIQLPLRSSAEPTLTETVAMYGTLDVDGMTSIPLRLPPDVHSDVGGMSVTLTSTLLGGLRDATANLITYPYGCAEQTSSRLLPLVAMSDLAGFVEATEIPHGRTVREFVSDGIARLLTMQQSDGGFSYWPSGTISNEYVSAYVTWVLFLADRAGHSVPPRALAAALDYLEGTTASPDLDLPDTVIYFADLRRAIAAYTLAEAGRDTTALVNRLLERRELPVFARAFALAALARSNPADPRVETHVRELTNLITETPGSASVVETPRYDLGAYFHSDLRSSAIAMMALVRAKPDHGVIVKLARGLMEKRYKGAWRNTQENAYALVALADYARHFEREEPNFEVRAWIDNAILVDDRWSGRSSKARTGSIPMVNFSALAGRNPDQTIPLNLRRKGTGRAYYRLAMTYAPSSVTLEPRSRGIRVSRRFRRDGEAATQTAPRRLQAGEVIAIDVSVSTKALLRYVAIDVPAAAGLEPIDLGLGSRKTLPMSGVHGWWTSHVEHHDDRVLIFADTLQPGEHTHTVYFRATTPGRFSFPPTHAEAMYTPEVFGRTDGNVLEVVE